MKLVASLILLPVIAAAAPYAPHARDAAIRWGEHGHEISGRAAATNLPAAMPAFFRNATDQLAYLNPEPDRWRGSNLRELNEAMRYDHYIDLEVIPEEALGATDRHRYLYILHDAGLAHPAREAGLLPFRIVELYQRLVVNWRLWRETSDQDTRQLIEQRIINDAGILGHYVADAANPHHTTVHHNRWAEGYVNPRNFTTEPGFHGRFESDYVGANIDTDDLLPHVAAPRTLGAVRLEVMAHIQRSHARVERLYELDQVERWSARTRGAAHRDFAVERLAAGANMLRDLWWSAWIESGTPQPQRR